MKAKYLYISLSLFAIFISSSFLVNAGATSAAQTSNQSYATSQQTGATGNITSVALDGQTVAIGDQVISSFWSDIPAFEVSEYTVDTTQGYVKSAHDDYYSYFLFAYASSLKWIAVELDADTANCMEAGHDGWVFGNSSSITGFSWVGDVHFLGDNQHPAQDARNDVSFERVTDSASGLTFVEMKRALDTGDTAGNDIVFTIDTTYTVKFASEKAHKQGERAVYTLAISSNVIQAATTTTEPVQTTSKLPEEIKADNLNSILTWASIGFFFNIILINMLMIYGRRS